MIASVRCKHCGWTRRDDVYPERCDTCGAPLPAGFLGLLPRWRGILITAVFIVLLVAVLPYIG